MWTAAKLFFGTTGGRISGVLLLAALAFITVQEFQKLGLRRDIAGLNNTVAIEKQANAAWATRYTSLKDENNMLVLGVQRQNDAIQGMKREAELGSAKAAQRGLASLLQSAARRAAMENVGTGPDAMNTWAKDYFGGQS